MKVDWRCRACGRLSTASCTKTTSGEHFIIEADQRQIDAYQHVLDDLRSADDAASQVVS